MQLSASLAFGVLLKRLRKEAGMTQRDLAAALGYSESLICSLEKAQRLPDLQAVAERFIPALGLQDDRAAADALIEQAALARGQRVPVTFQRTTKTARQAEIKERRVDLPPLPTALIGRESIVNQLCHRLAGHQGRLLTFVGAPGVGKTTLALAVAATVQAFYADGAIFVPLAAIDDPALMAVAILIAAGSGDTDAKSPQSRLIGFLRRKKMLLILDNLEQIDGAADLIALLLMECPDICVLATSRERLHLRAEQRFKVPPLNRAAALELFVQRAQVVAADFRLTPHNQPTVEAICQWLDCLPLALELCAAQIDLLSPAQLLAHLQTRPLDLLVDGPHDLPPRQRTLRSAILHSYALLGEEEQLLLRSLGVFVGGFALAEVSVIIAEWLAIGNSDADDATVPLPIASHSAERTQRTLHTLIDNNLVRSETTVDSEYRFFLLETIRGFALEQLRSQGEEARLRQAHYAVYLRLFRTGDRHLRGPDATSWLTRLQSERDNLRAALQWTLDEAHYTDAAWLMMAVSYFWVLSGDGYEEARWLARLLPHRHVLASDLRLAFLLTFYRAAADLQEFQPIDRWTEEVMALLEVCEDRLLHAFAWSLIAGTMADVGEATAARERGIALARAAGKQPGLGVEFGAISDQNFVLVAYLRWYAERLIQQGDWARAVPLVSEGLERARAQGDPWGIGDGYGLLGRLALLQGDLGQAQRCFHEAVTIAATFNSRRVQCTWQPFLGIVTLYSGNATEARLLLNESLQLCLQLKDSLRLRQIYTYLAEVALSQGELDQAAQWLAQSLAYNAQTSGDTFEEVQRRWVAARLATAQRRYARAAALFGLAEQAHSQIRHVIRGPLRAQADAALATVQAALGAADFAAAFAAGQAMSLEGAFATLCAPSRA